MKQEQPKDKQDRLLGSALGGAILGGSLGGPPGALFGGLGALLLAEKVNKMNTITKSRAFISFDYDHDLDLKTMLAGQAKHDDTPFDIVDASIKEAILLNWKDKARTRIKGCDRVIVICGLYTHLAAGVSAEVKIAQEEGVPYFLLWGRSGQTCTKPTAALATDSIYKWTWDNLKSLIHGNR